MCSSDLIAGRDGPSLPSEVGGSLEESERKLILATLEQCGGDKRKQSPDIERALEYLKDYKERAGTS